MCLSLNQSVTEMDNSISCHLLCFVASPSVPSQNVYTSRGAVGPEANKANAKRSIVNSQISRDQSALYT